MFGRNYEYSIFPTVAGCQGRPFSSGYFFLFSPTSSGRAMMGQSAMQMTAMYSCMWNSPSIRYFTG